MEGGGLKQLPPVEGGLVGVEGAALTAGLGVATQGPKLGVWPLRQLWAWGQAERRSVLLVLQEIIKTITPRR